MTDANNVKKLPVVAKDDPNQAAISKLEELLESAKVGKLQGFAIAYADSEGFCNSTWVTGGARRMSLVGAVSWLLHRMNSEEG